MPSRSCRPTRTPTSPRSSPAVSGAALPHWLAPERYAPLRDGLDRLTLFEGPIEAAATTHGPFDGFNLSDIFEYLDTDLSREIYARLLASAKPRARFAYWNMLVPRRCPKELAGRVRSLEDEERRLFAGDLAFFYSAFVLEEVVG